VDHGLADGLPRSIDGKTTRKEAWTMSSATSLLKYVIASLVLLTATMHPAPAQDYPTKPIRLIIPFPPGGSNDIVGRLIATGLSARLGKQVVVDNRTGASGIVATELVANSPPDGYTLLYCSLAFASNPAFHKLRYDPIKSFTPVAFIGRVPGILLIHPSVPVNSVKELIEYAQQHPGKLNFAHSGTGSFMHLSATLFLHSSKTDMVLVPFKGGGPAMIDIIGGHTQLAMGSVLAAMPHVKSGKLKALGVGSTKRVSSLPDVPTIDESGLPGYQSANWWGILAPAGTPAPIVEKLHKTIGEVQSSPELKAQLANEGAEIIKMSTADFGKFIESELAKWGEVVKAAGIAPQ
jgi:tripartite-type tricarboxylate transporter receptor subunit TctC